MVSDRSSLSSKPGRLGRAFRRDGTSHWQRVRRGIEAAGGHGLPLDTGVRRILEDTLGADLGCVRIHTGPSADRLASAVRAEAFASGSDLFFREGVYNPGTERGMYLLAHEATHVVQQAHGLFGGRLLPAGVVLGRASDLAERQADAAAISVLNGGPAPLALPPVGPETRSPTPRQSLLHIQRHDSFEHRLLGDLPTADLVAVSANASNRREILERQRDLLWLWHQDPESVTEPLINRLCPWIRTLRLNGSGQLVTYGELNALPDFLANPLAVDSLPRGIVLPLLQVIRQQGYNRVQGLLGISSTVTFQDAAATMWPPGLINTLLETRAIDQLTLHLGINGADHYQGLLARNACHFAPYSWYRWQAHYLIARDLAQKAHASGDPNERARLTYEAWVNHGYADHFLQDSFAAGHLINKTLIMQWFIRWAARQSLVPVADWDRVKNMTPERQPGLAGRQLYAPGYPGPSNDPQTTEELPTYGERMRGTGVVADGTTSQNAAYQNFLTFLSGVITQSASAALHDYYNANSLWVGSVAHPQAYEVWGDDTLLSGANGAEGTRNTSEAAQTSQLSIIELLANGQTGITVQGLRDRFPTTVMSAGGSMISLEAWNDSLVPFCESTIFPGLHDIIVRILNPRISVVSRDQVFVNTWNTSLPSTGYTIVDVVSANNRLYAGSNGYVYDLDPDTGIIRHSVLLTSPVGVGDYETRLAADGQMLYAGVHGYVYGVPLGSFGSSSWNTGVGGRGYNRASVLANAGRLYAGCNGYVYELDPSNGKVRRQIGLGSAFGSGDYDTRLATDGQTLYAGVHGYVYGIRISDFKQLWYVGVGGTGYNPANVLVQGGRLFAGCNGYVYDINPGNGHINHTLRLTSLVGVGDYETRLAADGQMLYAGVHGYVYGVPLGSFGSSSWNTGVGGTGYNRASVATQDGRLFAGCNGYVYELEPSNGTVLYSLLLGSIVGMGNYETRIVPSGDSLFAGVHGYAYKVAI
ncbi:MAG: DUF4157 domain-containing protein [Chloroflexota bacterium]|nr:DUF4157 domain-containing protein [Chloroflexota bacterium]